MKAIFYNHLSQTEKEQYKASVGMGCYLFHLKKDGRKYKKSEYYDFVGSEKTAEDVIARLEGLNPGSKWVAA